MSVLRVRFNKKKVEARLSGICKKGTFILATELLKDANYYARMQSGELIRSSLRASEPEKGILRWDTPYARRVYYVGSPNAFTNPNASLMWAHRASKENRRKYLEIIKKIAEGGRQ